MKINAFAALDKAGFCASNAQRKTWPGGFAPDAPEFSWERIFQKTCPRFERMDALCKWTVAAIEMLELDELLPKPDREKTALYLATTLGSWQTDISFLKSLGRPGGASPLLFAYTLPSAAIGEACIRHSLQGPLQCFSREENQPDFILQEAAALLKTGAAAACIAVFADTAHRPGASAWLAMPDAKADAAPAKIQLQKTCPSKRKP